jgi:hypothetical protein
MMKRHYRLYLPALLLALTGSIAAPGVYAQEKIPLQNQDAASAAAVAGKHLEVEVLEVGPHGALPAEIHRPAGKFILLVVNGTHDPAAVFALVPEAAGDGVTAAKPMLRLTDRAPSTKHKIAGLVDLPAGQFDLKAAATGKVLCRITIE